MKEREITMDNADGTAISPLATTRWFRLALTAIPVCLTNTLAWFGVYTFVNGYVIRELGYSNRAWTTLTLWFFGGLLVWQTLSTELVAKFGRRRTIALGMFISAAGYLVLTLTTHFFLIALLIAVISMAVAVNLVAWFAMVAEIGGQTPGRALAINNIVSVLVGGIAMIAGGYLAGLGRYCLLFILLACVGVLSTAMFWLLSAQWENTQPLHVISLRRISRGQWLQMARGPFAAILVLGFLCEPLNHLTVNQLFPNLGRDVHAMNESMISTIVGIGRWPALATLFLMAYWIDRLNPIICYGLSVAITGVTVCVMGMVDSTFMVTADYLLYYAAYGLIWASNSAAINSMVDSRVRESAFALAGVAATVGILLVGIVHNRMLAMEFSLLQIFQICGTCAIVVGLILTCMGTKLTLTGSVKSFMKE